MDSHAEMSTNYMVNIMIHSLFISDPYVHIKKISRNNVDFPCSHIPKVQTFERCHNKFPLCYHNRS